MNAVPSGSRTLHLSAAAAELPRLAAWLGEILTGLGAGDRDRFRVDLAATEVVTNILSYGLAGQATAEIRLEGVAAGGKLSLTISDGGPAFDPLQAPEKVLPTRLEDAAPGGLGLVLIRNYADEVRYARVDGENRLTLVFRLAAPGTPPAGPA